LSELALEARWLVLERDASGRAGRVSEGGVRDAAPGSWVTRLPVSAACGVFIGLTQPEKLRILRVEVAREGIPPGMRLSQSDGFNLDVEFDSHRRLAVISLACKPLGDRQVFSAFTESVLRGLRPDMSPRECVDLLLQRIDRWRKFFSGEAKGLRPEARAGLYGELYVLLHILGPIAGLQDAVNAWVGPERAAQDYHFPDVAIEVKATRGTPPGTARITNVAQLHGGGLHSLLLLVTYLDSHGSDGGSLPGLVAEARAALKGDWASQQRFELLLELEGYCDAHAPAYVELYTVRHLSLYKVVDGFPRLTPETVPPGIEDVRYSLSLAACGSWERPIESLPNYLRDSE
jgi:hypothetical protein